ncbi:MAG TPA: amidase [Solirubrobacteraceae bacterium]|jgi:amidase
MKLATTEDSPTTEEDLAFAGVARQAQLLADGEVSSQQLLKLYQDRIAAIDGQLGAFRCLRDEAQVEAEEADRRLAAGERSPLLGVPVAIKDEFDIAGQETRFGCPGSFEVKRSDCESVRRLREAGAIVVGKTNTPELGQWPFTEGPAFGASRNPWSLGHTPGGSSGGTAAAVAAGLIAGATGADGAGSVRIPAAWTGLVGIKPQRGRISTWPDPKAFNGLTCIGPLARTVGDAALMLDVLSGNHPEDRHKPPPPSQPFAAAAIAPPRRLKIALSLKIPFSLAPAHLQPQVKAAVLRLAEALATLGHEVVEADPPYGIVGFSFLPRSTMGLREWVQRVPDPTLLDPRTLHNARLGSRFGRPGLALAHALEPPLKHFVGRIFKDVDVVLTPTTAKPPERIGAIDGLGNWDTDKVMVSACPYAWPWNVLGWPGINVPAGLTHDGLPLGAQLLGPACSEPLLISLAAQLEQVERWHERRPPALMPQQL